MGWTWRYTFPVELLGQRRRGSFCRGKMEHPWDDRSGRSATCTECGTTRQRVRV